MYIARWILRLQTHSQNMFYLVLLSHCNSDCTNEPQCHNKRTLPAFLYREFFPYHLSRHQRPVLLKSWASTLLRHVGKQSQSHWRVKISRNWYFTQTVICLITSYTHVTRSVALRLYIVFIWTLKILRYRKSGIRISRTYAYLMQNGVIPQEFECSFVN